jgi:hypothetical protein
MQGMYLTPTFRQDGALTANEEYFVAFPFPVTFMGMSVYLANTTSVILDVGSAASKEAYIKDLTVTGTTDTVNQYGKSSMVGTEYAHIDANTAICVSVDYDGGAGGDGSDLTVMLLFTEG